MNDKHLSYCNWSGEMYFNWFETKIRTPLEEVEWILNGY